MLYMGNGDGKRTPSRTQSIVATVVCIPSVPNSQLFSFSTHLLQQLTGPSGPTEAAAYLYERKTCGKALAGD